MREHQAPELPDAVEASAVLVTRRYLSCEIEHAGGLLGRNAQGLRGRGTLTIDSEHVVFTGTSGWPVWAIVFVMIITGFAVLETVPSHLWFRVPMLFVVWAAVIMALRGGHGRERYRLSTVRKVKRVGRSLQMSVDGLSRAVSFVADSPEVAEEIEWELALDGKVRGGTVDVGEAPRQGQGG